MHISTIPWGQILINAAASKILGKFRRGRVNTCQHIFSIKTSNVQTPPKSDPGESQTSKKCESHNLEWKIQGQSHTNVNLDCYPLLFCPCPLLAYPSCFYFQIFGPDREAGRWVMALNV